MNKTTNTLTGRMGRALSYSVLEVPGSTPGLDTIDW